MIVSKQVSVGQTPVALATGAAQVSIRFVSSTSSVAYYIGDASVSPSTGLPLEGNAQDGTTIGLFQIKLGKGDTLYAISNPTSTVTIAVLIVA